MKKITLTLLLLTLCVSLCMPTISAYASMSTEVNNNYKTTYELDTGIIGYATVTTFIDTADDLEAIKGLSDLSAKAPAMAILRVKNSSGLKVVDKNGEELASLTDVINDYTADKIIPAFYVSGGDTNTASSLQNYIVTNDIEDAFVISNNGDTLKSVLFRKNVMGTYSKLIVGGMLEFENAKDLTWKEINVACYNSGARVALIDYNDKTKAELHALYDDRLYGVPMSVFIKVDNATEMQSAVLDGAWGITVSDWKGTIDFMESFKQNVVVRPMNIIAHRGMDVLYQENSLEGIIEAAKLKVSVIEVDPRLSKDNQIVLSHDADVHRITGFSGYVKDYTLQQLKAMEVTVNGNAGVARIATLEEVFQTYKKYGFTTKIILDAKETNPVYFQILYDLIEKYDMWHVISGVGIADKSQSDLVKSIFGDKIPWERVGSTTVEVKSKLTNQPDTIKETIANWMTVLSNGHSTGTGSKGSVSPYYDEIVKSAGISYAIPEVVRAANDRGIKVTPYQFDTVPVMEEAFLLGLADYSTGWADYFKDFPEYLTIDSNALTVEEGKTINFNAKTIVGSGAKTSVSMPSYIVVDGDANVIKADDGEIFAVSEGQVVVRLFTTYKNGNIVYQVYSDPITVNVTAKQEVIDNNDNQQTDFFGCAAGIVNNGGGFSGPFGPAIIALSMTALYILIKRRRETN